MTRLDHPPPQRGPLHLPTLNIAQALALFVELRDLAHELIGLLRQQTALLREQASVAVADDLDCITVAEAAELLSFDSRTIHRMIAEGELAAVGSAKRLRVRRASLREYLEGHRDR